jgi:hypothetical protein
VAALIALIPLAVASAFQVEIVTDADGRVIRRPEEGPGGVSAPGPIQRARAVTEEFTSALPDFVCDQLTWRNTSDSRPVKWRVRDRVTAEVLYVEGQESYRNVLVNGKRPKGDDPHLTGTWSTGEYGTTLKDVLAASTGARFQFVQDSQMNGRLVKKFDYQVDRRRSHWRVVFTGMTLYPAYEGSIWIDKESFRLLRLEMIARDVPPAYPLDIIQMTIDYGQVIIAGQSYLLPVRAENLACERLSLACSRNETEFRNYRRFTAESTVTTTDSTITFEGVKKQ